MLFAPKKIFCFLFFLYCFIGEHKTKCRKAKKYHRIRHSEIESSSTDDSLKLFQLEVCDRQKFQIKCPTHTKISIENAFYGNPEVSKTVCGSNNDKHKTKKKNHFLNDAHFEEAQCEFLNAPQKIMEYCQNKEECGFKLKPNIFGFDSACSQKTPNFLQIWYKCRPRTIPIYTRPNCCRSCKSKVILSKTLKGWNRVKSINSSNWSSTQ